MSKLLRFIHFFTNEDEYKGSTADSNKVGTGKVGYMKI